MISCHHPATSTQHQQQQQQQQQQQGTVNRTATHPTERPLHSHPLRRDVHRGHHGPLLGGTTPPVDASADDPATAGPLTGRRCRRLFRRHGKRLRKVLADVRAAELEGHRARRRLSDARGRHRRRTLFKRYWQDRGRVVGRRGKERQRVSDRAFSSGETGGWQRINRRRKEERMFISTPRNSPTSPAAVPVAFGGRL